MKQKKGKQYKPHRPKFVTSSETWDSLKKIATMQKTQDWEKHRIFFKVFKFSWGYEIQYFKGDKFINMEHVCISGIIGFIEWIGSGFASVEKRIKRVKKQLIERNKVERIE